MAVASPSLKRSHDLVEQVVEHLAGPILGGDLAEGAILPAEGAIVEQLGVSRTVVREAMRVLSVRGLVEVAHGKRPRVAAATHAPAAQSLQTLMQRQRLSLADLGELRRPLEAEIAALAAERATDRHLDQLAESLEQQEQAANLEAQIQADLAFHRSLADASGNPAFQTVLDPLTDLLLEARRRTIGLRGNALAVEHHRRIHRAVSRRQVQAARNAMIEHIQTSQADLAASEQEQEKTTR